MQKVNNSEQPLLSVCIPTYNRCTILMENLDRLSRNIIDKKNIQIVIGDNASSDETEQRVKSFIEEKQDLNIKYIRNNTNIADENFFYVLTHGDGVYLKLINDYTVLTEDNLKVLLNKINKYRSSKELYLNFCFNVRDVPVNTDEIRISNINEFILTLNNKLTWISNFGCFNYQLNGLENFLQYKDMMLLQMYWSLYLSEVNSKIIVCPLNSPETIPLSPSKRFTPYNFFTPHVKNYYSIIKSFTNLSSTELRKDKTRLLSDFVGNSIINFLILKRDCPFNLSGSWKILFKHFYDVPYFYTFIPLKLANRIFQKINKL